MPSRVDNFEHLAKFMKFDSPDEFYFVQILVRGKDGHKGEKGMNSNNKNRLIKFYTINSVEELLARKDEIVSVCEMFNARAYIHPTKRSYRSVAKKVLSLTTEMFISENDKGLKGVYSTACGQSYVTTDKKFLVDLDDDAVYREAEFIDYINQECEPLGKDKVLYTNPTLHGEHIITTPFNVKKFSDRYPDIDIHKNNPTLLYYNKHE